MPEHKCRAFILKRGYKNRTRCNKPFRSLNSQVGSLRNIFCPECVEEHYTSRTEEERKETLKLQRERGYMFCIDGCGSITTYEDGVCRSCRPKSGFVKHQESLNGNIWGDNKKRDPNKIYDEKGNEMGKESLIGTILFIVFFLGLIGIMLSLSQESNDYGNESLPGRYGYSISKVSSHI